MPNREVARGAEQGTNAFAAGGLTGTTVMSVIYGKTALWLRGTTADSTNAALSCQSSFVVSDRHVVITQLALMSSTLTI
jgi:hypothetical protein